MLPLTFRTQTVRLHHLPLGSHLILRPQRIAQADRLSYAEKLRENLP